MSIEVTKNIIRQHRAERDYLLAQTYFNRISLRQAENWLKSKLIKLIIGPRRAGKSVYGLLLL